MPRRTNGLNDQRPRRAVGVEHPELIRWRSLPLIENEADIEGSELLRVSELGSPIGAADLLVGDEGNVNRAAGNEGGGFEVSEGFEVLDGEALVVLGAAGEDTAGGVSDGCERGVEPLGGLSGDAVDMGVEEDGGKGGVGAEPGEENEGLAAGELQG